MYPVGSATVPCWISHGTLLSLKTNDFTTAAGRHRYGNATSKPFFYSMQAQTESAAPNVAKAVEDAAQKTADKTESTVTQAVDATKKSVENTATAVEKAQDAVSDTATKVGDAATNAVEAVAGAVSKTNGAVGDATKTAIETVAPPSTGDAVAATTEALSSNSIFFMALLLLILFVWYFVTEEAKRRRLVGSILAVAATVLCVFFYKYYPIEQGIELKGGVSMEIQIKEVPGRTVTPETQQQVINILEKRINSLATKELILAPSGKDGIFLQVPGATPEQLDKIQEVIEKVAKLEFSVVHDESRFKAASVASDAEVVVGYKALPYVLSEEEKKANLAAGKKADEPNRWELVKQIPDMSGKNVKSAAYYFGPEGHSIQVDFTSEGAGIMLPLTRENQGRPLAIIMDDEVISAPRINEPFSTGCSITGSFTREEAKALVAALENPLENPIEVANSNYISPTMGKLTVQQGINAGVAGLVIMMIFVVFYYRFAGAVALVGILLNIVVTFGILALFRFTLTMPGIAGIILSIGIAIDSNVLIYERLREELKAGKSLKTAIDLSYEKAFSAIFDSNITTLFTAIILYALATGTVKGFAITLMIGIVASLFTALLVTKVCFAWATASFLKKLSFVDLIPERTIDFLGKRKMFLTISVVTVVASILIVGLKDPRGVELKGGDALNIQASSDLTEAAIKESLKDLSLGAEPIIQSQEPVGGQGKFFLIRVPDNSGEIVQAELTKDLGIDTNHIEMSSVGSQAGKAMLINSAIALLAGMFSIFLYVTFRYEMAFALGAILALAHDVIVTAGLVTLLGQEMSLITIGALLTIAGYSINDTIVIFDRVRESLATKRGSIKDIMNHSLNATLARTLLTGGLTLVVVVVLFLFGGPGMRNFALTLIIGIIVGTYSTVYIASPIVLWWAHHRGTNLRREVLDTEQSKIDPLTAS